MYKRWRWKLHEHSQSLRPVGLPGRRTIAQNESWSQLFITCWVAPYPTPLTCHVKGWGSKLNIGATVRSCQSSAWHWSSRILKPMSRPDGESWAGKTASLPHHVKCPRIPKQRHHMAELWNVARPILPAITGRRTSYQDTMATLHRTDSLYRR